MKREKKPTRVCFVYDTETCNMVNDEGEHIAFPILFIVNDITSTSISKYVADELDDVKYFRHESDMMRFIEEAIEFGRDNEITPIVAAYNLMFDLQPIFASLSSKYATHVNAQSSTSLYTLDILDEAGETLLRFWDTSYLEPRGLKYMGETAGLSKASGDWDYAKIRTPETPLTDEELFYARRDVQVIPAYLRFLLESNDYLEESDLGTKLITKTSLIRLLGKRVISQLQTENGRSPIALMYGECKREAPKDYDTYAARKASFRGGLTFTAANNASKVHHNIASIDVTSMHHAFINGRYVPNKFQNVDNPKRMTRILAKIKNTELEDVLSLYHMPFLQCFNGCVRVKNLRLKSCSIFEREGIAILAEAKLFKGANASLHEDESKREAEAMTMSAGYKDRALNYENAYGKIYSAEEMFIYCNEIEWWNICQVYDFDEFEFVHGEMTHHHIIPPDYITLQSNILYEQKNEMKQILKKVESGEHVESVKLLPEFIKEKANEGKDALKYLDQYYQIIVKGLFNAIYGSQAQDVNKPGYCVDSSGSISIDDTTRKSVDTKLEDQGLVDYIYGSRIVAGSRMHLIIAMMLMWRKLNTRIKILGGDTDSLKLACAKSVTNEDILEALEPLHKAIRKAIARTMQRVRKTYPAHASTLEGIGEFEIEHHGGRYTSGCEYWNKCRMVRDEKDGFSITCAGVSRPADAYNLEKIANRMYEIGIEEENIYKFLIGYNTTYFPSVSFLLGHAKPAAIDEVHEKVKDYRGNVKEVNAHRSIALYPIAKTIGDELVESNYKNIAYKNIIGDDVRTSFVNIWQDEEKAYIEENGEIVYEIPKL